MSFQEIDTLDIPYDLGSILHYGGNAFSVNEKSLTIKTRQNIILKSPVVKWNFRDPFYQRTIGQRDALTFYDVGIINKAYCLSNTLFLYLKNISSLNELII